VAGRITSMKNSSDTIRNLTHDLPACGAVAQPAVLLCASFSLLHRVIISFSDTHVTKNSCCGRYSVRPGRRIGRVSYHQHVKFVFSSTHEDRL